MNQKGFTPILVILVIIILLGAAIGAYFVYSKPLSTNSPKPVISTSNKTLQQNIPSDWKTYTNFKYGYQIKVPSDLHIYSHIRDLNQERCIENYGIADTVYVNNDFREDCKVTSDKLVEIVAYAGNPDKDLGYPNGNADSPPKKYDLNGDVAYEYDFTKFNNSINQSFNHNGNAFGINFSKTIDYKKIFSTFHFLSKEELGKLQQPTPLPISYLKRYFKLSDKIINFKSYPEEIANKTDDQLVGISCNHSYGMWDRIPQTDIDSDSILKQITDLSSQAGVNNVNSVSYCQLEDSRVLVALYSFTDDWKTSAKTPNITANFGLLEKGKLDIKVKFNPGTEAGAPAIGFGPLEYTKDNVFYYTRDVGDAISIVEIHKVDLNQDEHKLLITCRDDYDDNNGHPIPKPSCK